MRTSTRCPTSWPAASPTWCRRVAVAIRTGYPCDGVTVRQNNEPAGGQDVWHLHTHVIPRYIGDGKYLGVPVRADDCDRARYAARLRELLR